MISAWTVHIVEHLDGRDRPSKKEFATEEEAFKYACLQRHSSSSLLIETPDGERYDETWIDDWCRSRGL
jgi:hypothetical protein